MLKVASTLREQANGMEASLEELDRLENIIQQQNIQIDTLEKNNSANQEMLLAGEDKIKEQAEALKTSGQKLQEVEKLLKEKEEQIKLYLADGDKLLELLATVTNHFLTPPPTPILPGSGVNQTKSREEDKKAEEEAKNNAKKGKQKSPEKKK